jgi:cystathionine beta-lyase
VRASVAAYRDGGPWLDDVVGYLDGSRTLLAELLAERLPEVGYRPPEGTYLAWLDCRSLFADRGGRPPGERPLVPLADESPAEFFLAKARVMLTDGAACGGAGHGHVRLNFATPRPILTEIVRRLAGAVSGS